MLSQCLVLISTSPVHSPLFFQVRCQQNVSTHLRDALIIHFKRASSLDIPQRWPQLHTVNGKVGRILDRLFLHATRPDWNPGGAAAKERRLSRIPRAWESWWLQVWGWHICLNCTFSIIQNKGRSGSPVGQPFHGTGFGTCGWEKCTEPIIISSNNRRVIHWIKKYYYCQITISESHLWLVKLLTVCTITFVKIYLFVCILGIIAKRLLTEEHTEAKPEVPSGGISVDSS